MSPTSEPVLLLSTWSDAEAEMIRQLLASYGIDCSLSSHIPHSVLPLNVDGLGEIRIHVPAAALDEARRIVDAYRGTGPPEATGQAAVVTMAHAVQAPTRIDLAGGTLDIWPLYLMLDNPVTVNVAIDLHAQVSVTSLRNSRIDLASDDLDLQQTAATTEELDVHGALPLPARLVQAFAPAGGVALRTRSSVPAGSGLGGSSALAAGMAVALLQSTGRLTGINVHALARHLANIEAQVLGIPTGVQDYYPPLLGGLLKLTFAAGGITAERLPVDRARLEERLVLIYEGETRSSGISNLDMVRRFLEDEGTTRAAMADVAEAATEMAEALVAGDLDAAGEAMTREMAARRQLSPTVVTETGERLFAAAAAARALGGKVCGAGGGGCSVFWAPAGGKERLVEALVRAGGKPLPFRVAETGLLAAAEPS